MDRYDSRQRHDSTRLRNLDELRRRSPLRKVIISEVLAKSDDTTYVSTMLEHACDSRELGDAQTGRVRGSSQSKTRLDDGRIGGRGRDSL